MLMNPLLRFLLRVLFALGVAIPALWTNSALLNRTDWAILLLIGVVVIGISAHTLPIKFPIKQTRFIFLLLIALFFWLTGTEAVSSVTHVFTALLLSGISLLVEQRDGVAKIAAVSFGIIIALGMTELGAAWFLNRAQTLKAQAIPTTTTLAPEVTATAAESPTVVQSPMPTATVTPTIDPEVTPTITPTPEPPRPVAGMGYVDFQQDNGQPEWAIYTGYGPRINSVAHAYMYDDQGRKIYDTRVEFNGKGYRGPEVAYEKPSDVYRIMIIGDSFVEAIQVNYEDTFYARLIQMLATQNTNKRRFEIIPMGRMGWGTLQEYLYYQVEGYKYQPDLVIDMFYINDVADNFPRFFYPDINNTNYDYVFDADSVRIVDTNLQGLPPNTARKLYNALPPVLQSANLTRLIVRLFDPPPTTVTPGGVLSRVHPQYYIYVKSPEPEGYTEGWRRTEWAMQHFAQAVTKNGSKFAVLSVFIGAEMVANVSQWFPDQVRGWQWDDTLPDQKLAQILTAQPASIIPTRPGYEAYAKQAGGQVYNLIFISADGHWNKTGHELTAKILYEWLVAEGIAGS
jgi:hypothetical protein